jgi:hypothetical protein
MAHFAELDEQNIVKRVIVISNKDTSDANGVEKEHIGAAFCERLLGGRWVQTSYNGKFRKHYAGTGMIYNEEIDAFMSKQPYPSWTLNRENATWDPPIPKPEEGLWNWNEQQGQWIPINSDDNQEE